MLLKIVLRSYTALFYKLSLFYSALVQRMSARAEVLIMDEKLAGFSNTVNTVIAAEKATLNNITDAHDALLLPA